MFENSKSKKIHVGNSWKNFRKGTHSDEPNRDRSENQSHMSMVTGLGGAQMKIPSKRLTN